jgi:hypothetical protein
VGLSRYTGVLTQGRMPLHEGQAPHYAYADREGIHKRTRLSASFDQNDHIDRQIQGVVEQR